MSLCVGGLCLEDDLALATQRLQRFIREVQRTFTIITAAVRHRFAAQDRNKVFPFRGVSGFVALQEEVFRQRAGAALFAVVLHLVLKNVARAKQPFGAVQFQALVVAVR